MTQNLAIEPEDENRPLPHNIEAEQALLGAILVNNEAFDRVSEFLLSNHFYEPVHQRIYQIASELIGAGKLVTPVTMKTFLTEQDLGQGVTSSRYLARLAAEATTIINAEDYGRTVHDLSVRRDLIVIGREIVNTAYDAPVDASPYHQIKQAEGRLGAAAEAGRIVTRIRATPFKPLNREEIPPRRFIYGRHYARGFVSATIALSGIGKSALDMAEAIAICTGRNLLGVDPTETTNVWIWNGEDPREELARRLIAITDHYDIPQEDLGGKLFYDSGRSMDIIIAEQTRSGILIARPVVRHVIAAIRENEIGVLQIDPFVSCHRVTENDNNAIDAVAKEWARIADTTDCAIELVHHSRKTGGAEVGLEDGRGAGALVAATRSARVLNGMTPEEAERVDVENWRSYFRVTNAKTTLAPPVHRSDWFRFVSVDLGNGPEGGIGDNVGVVTAWSYPDPLASVTVGDIAAVQKKVSGGKWRADVQAHDWVGKAIAEALKLDINNKAHKATIKEALRGWIGSGYLKKVPRDDDKGKSRPHIEVGTWIT